MKGIRSAQHPNRYRSAPLPPLLTRTTARVPGADSEKSELFGFGYYGGRYPYYPYYGYYRPYYGYGYGGGGGYPYPYYSYPWWGYWWNANGYGTEDGPGATVLTKSWPHEGEKRLETRGVVTRQEARQAAEWLNIDVDEEVAGANSESKFQTWWYAMQVETEHGYKGGRQTNVTNDDLVLTAKITLAHLRERKDYYHRLHEAGAEKHREGIVKEPGRRVRFRMPTEEEARGGPEPSTHGMKGLSTLRYPPRYHRRQPPLTIRYY